MSTASRAFTVPHRLNSITLERVRAAADRVGYSRPRPPRALDGIIALIVSDVGNPFFTDIIRGIQQQLRTAGLRVMLIDADESPEEEADALRYVSTRCAGAIVAASRISDDELTVLASTIPTVAVNRIPADVSSVVIDPAQGLREVVEHLVSLAHEHIAYVAGPPGSWSGWQRERLLRRVLAEHGLDLHTVGPYAPTIVGGAAAADAVSALGATAAVCFNDLLAVGALARFQARGVRVPDDMSVIGFDDSFVAAISTPTLTTVTADGLRCGQAAVGLLTAALGEAAEPRHLGLSTHLTVRASTGAAPRSGVEGP